MSSSERWQNGSPGATCQSRGICPPGDTGTGLSTGSAGGLGYDPLLTPQQAAERLNVSVDWVRDHSSRKKPRLPVIRLGGGPGRAGLLRYRASQIEKFIEEMECLSNRRSRRI
jgi:hypothetical protein